MLSEKETEQNFPREKKKKRVNSIEIQTCPSSKDSIGWIQLFLGGGGGGISI